MLGAVLLGGLGALAGSQADLSSSTGRTILGPEGQSERLGREAIGNNLPELGRLVSMGPGMAAIQQANQSSNDLANMLRQFSQGGYLPNQQDFATAGQFAQSAFAPQQTAINQQFDEEKQRASQLAAQLGRPVNDPIIQAKLSQERMRAQERLGASQSAFASEFALSQPQQRLGYTAQLADIQQGLASQAMANRQALISMGSQIQGQGQSFRANTATRTQEGTSGGGLKGALMGGIAGFGAGMSAFGGGGGGQSSPLAQGVGSALGSYMGTSSSSSGGGYNLGGNYDFSAPSLSAAAPGLKSQLANFGAPTSTSGQGYNYQFHSVPPAPSFQYNGQFGPQVNPSVPFWQR